MRDVWIILLHSCQFPSSKLHHDAMKLLYPQVAEQTLELVFLRKVIVTAEHIREKALSETPGTGKD